MDKFKAIEHKDGTVNVYEDDIYIGTINLSDFPFAGFARIMRAANLHPTPRAVDASPRAEKSDNNQGSRN